MAASALGWRRHHLRTAATQSQRPMTTIVRYWASASRRGKPRDQPAVGGAQTELSSQLYNRTHHTHLARLKRSRAMELFETEKIHPGTTGLVDNWRLKLTPPPSTVSPQLSTQHASVTPEYQQLPGSSTRMATPMRMLTPTMTPTSTPTPTPTSTPMLTPALTPISVFFLPHLSLLSY